MMEAARHEPRGSPVDHENRVDHVPATEDGLSNPSIRSPRTDTSALVVIPTGEGAGPTPKGFSRQAAAASCVMRRVWDGKHPRIAHSAACHPGHCRTLGGNDPAPACYGSITTRMPSWDSAMAKASVIWSRGKRWEMKGFMSTTPLAMSSTALPWCRGTQPWAPHTNSSL